MKEVCRLLGVTQSTTTPYYPMCNDLVEKFNGTLKKMLKRLCNDKPKQWHRYINALLFAYREVPQDSTHFAPFELIYGRTKEGAADVKFGEALTHDQNRELQLMVQRFSEIFSDRPGDTNLAEHRIDLTSDVPVRQTPYPVLFALKSLPKKELPQMKDLGIIRKSDSPYVSPVVVVKKKNGSNRICIDFRRLNKITVTDPQPVPSPAESFLGMSEDKYFSKLDLTKGYHQICVRP
ncbi:hypothetical protein RRG08_031687 [Elysia crispata]|uniref:Integrase catalytic domain-containing protein n=1 Tax=Elysia crispata TaxID=231223 RepID=A0AAE1AAS3_9GAST|nr:hypothetical protein RRG08_031687 [Elysia crispata]